MKISTKGRYALRLMLDLALADSSEPIPLRDVAKRQDISDKYLEQIVTQLSRADLVRSVRGAKGGYHLTRDPEDCTVGAILRTVEGSIAPVSCLDDEVNQCARCKECVTLDLWAQVDQAISNVVDHVTLADLVDKQRRIDARCTAGRGQRGNC